MKDESKLSSIIDIPIGEKFHTSKTTFKAFIDAKNVEYEGDHLDFIIDDLYERIVNLQKEKSVLVSKLDEVYFRRGVSY